MFLQMHRDIFKTILKFLRTKCELIERSNIKLVYLFKSRKLIHIFANYYV